MPTSVFSPSSLFNKPWSDPHTPWSDNPHKHQTLSRNIQLLHITSFLLFIQFLLSETCLLPFKASPALLLLHFLLNSEGSVSSRLSSSSRVPPVSISHLSLPLSRHLIIIAFQENTIGQILPGGSQETKLCGIHSVGQLTIKDGKMGGKL